VPHYDRHTGGKNPVIVSDKSVLDDDVDAMDEAAQALREAEVEAVRPAPPAPPSVDRQPLENMSIDELRALATKLNIPNLGAITEQEHLIAAIRERM
jgi:hypothetical protein